MFAHLPAFGGDPILALLDEFKRDANPNRVTLGIGLYLDDDGQLPILESVKLAEQRVAATPQPAGYLPMDGTEAYRSGVAKLVFGDKSDALAAGRIATMHTPGGSGGLHIGARFIRAFFPTSEVWVSDPTWDNHFALLEGAGCKVHTYPYYDSVNNRVRFEEMMAFFKTLPAYSTVLLQPCCHNPTGMDMTRAQWLEVMTLLQDRKLIPFLDMAYQGFGDGLDEDAWVVREMVEHGLMPLVATSMSKNFSLYGERVGSLSVVCPTKEQAALVQGQLQVQVRGTYSGPSLHGSRLVSMILNDDSLRAQWVQDVTHMRTRMQTLRGKLAANLSREIPQVDLSYLGKQKGMFSFTGLTPQEVDSLRVDHAVYLLPNGRMCVAGLSDRNIDYVSNAIVSTLKQRVEVSA